MAGPSSARCEPVTIRSHRPAEDRRWATGGYRLPVSIDVTVRAADLEDPDLVAFLAAHLAELEPTAPPESRHALDLEGLRSPAVRMWEARVAGQVAGTIALADLGPGHAELKSLRTSPALRGRGIGALLLEVALDDARSRQLGRVSLETGSAPLFDPARRLYARRGFTVCGPFGSYVEDPHSVFMTLELPVAEPAAG